MANQDQTQEQGRKQYIISVSYGNDSIALIQYAYERGLKNCWVVYCDTGWSHPDWEARVREGELFVKRLGFRSFRLKAKKQFSELVKARSMFPTNKYQWCTKELKVVPFAAFLKTQDPEAKAIIMIGKRRAESRARKLLEEFEVSEKYYNGRQV